MFTQGQIYKRKNIHDQYGGNAQSGIVTLSSHPYIFIFSGSSGHKYGYKDGWAQNGIYYYTGFGQIGDMEFKFGNKALRDHIENNERVFLFKYVRKGYVQFESELRLHKPPGYFSAPDREGNMRKAIRFFFQKREEQDDPALLYASEPEVKYDIQSSVPEHLSDYQDDLNKATEKKQFVNTRIGQGKYRQDVLERWKFKCAVTKFDDIRILIASHIIPWKDSNAKERLDVNNGILLSPVYDALFDKHLISFKSTGEIVISTEMKLERLNKLGITGKEEIKGLSKENIVYLKRHREQLR